MKNRTPSSGSMNKNAINYQYRWRIAYSARTSLRKHTAFELRHRWYVCIKEVTRISIFAICVIIVEEIEKKIPLTKPAQHSQHERKRYWRRAWIWRNAERSPEGKEEKLRIFRRLTFVYFVRGLSVNIRKVKEKGNEAWNTLEGYETEKKNIVWIGRNNSKGLPESVWTCPKESIEEH
jgi:hypothetical protein